MTDFALSELVNRQVPRYTSYPTAPHLHSGVGPERCEAWLNDVRRSREPVSLYLHVPFCREICHYCGCATRASRRDEPILAYANLLRREIALIAGRLDAPPVSHIHWGGGTPSLLPAQAFASLVGELHDRFDVLPAAEHAIELDPRSVTSELCARLAAAGVNRASLGVQDFDPAVQAAIGRPQPREAVISAVRKLRKAGIDQINFDLIYGLPNQTLESMAATAMQAVALEPDRVALFGYAHVPWMRPHQRLIEASLLPDSALRLELAAVARDVLHETGYASIGIDHFALPHNGLAAAMRAGALRRNFQGYTTDQSNVLLGLGASSISRLPGGFAQNAIDVASYGRSIERGELATARGVELTPDDRLRGEIIERIMCCFSVDLAQVCVRHDVDASSLAFEIEALEPLRRSGFIRFVGDRLMIVRDGPTLARIVASAFDAYLNAQARHSLAA